MSTHNIFFVEKQEKEIVNTPSYMELWVQVRGNILIIFFLISQHNF